MMFPFKDNPEPWKRPGIAQLSRVIVYSRLQMSAETLSQDEVTRAALGRVLSLIDSRYNNRLGIDILSDEAHFSRYHFIRTFRRHLFETPHQYIIRKRIEKARELLALSDLSITEICLEVGFESLGSFSTLFHRVVGWSPSVYRARSREQRRHPRKYIPACCWEMFGFGINTQTR
jgi:AraC-like DNA-binding protein